MSSGFRRHQMLAILKTQGFSQDGLIYEDYVAALSDFPSSKPVTRDQFEVICDMAFGKDKIVYPSTVQQFIKNIENGVR